MNVVILVIVATTLCASCSQQYSDIDRIGAFEVTNYMSRDTMRWEGGNTGLLYSTVCNSSDQTCFTRNDESGLKAGYRVSEGLEYISVITNNHNAKKLEGFTYYLFMTESGFMISCLTCNNSDHANPLEHLFWGWVNESNLIVKAKYRLPDSDVYRIYIFKVVGNEYFTIMLGEYSVEGRGTKLGNPYSDPESSRFAWIICEQRCSLVIHDSVSGAESRQSTDCSAADLLRVRWVEGKAMALCEFG